MIFNYLFAQMISGLSLGLLWVTMYFNLEGHIISMVEILHIFLLLKTYLEKMTYEDYEGQTDQAAEFLHGCEDSKAEIYAEFHQMIPNKILEIYY